MPAPGAGSCELLVGCPAAASALCLVCAHAADQSRVPTTRQSSLKQLSHPFPSCHLHRPHILPLSFQSLCAERLELRNVERDAHGVGDAVHQRVADGDAQCHSE